MKAIIQAKTRNILDAYNKENISYSRMNEMFNELADEWAIKFAEWIFNESKTDIKELLEIFKKEKIL